MTSAGGSAMRIFRKEPQQGTNADGKQDLLGHQYEQICQSYYKIEEFRGRLLALWPILEERQAARLPDSSKRT
jgi:hypothetical protein